MPLDFPSNPRQDQEYEDYKYQVPYTAWLSDAEKTGFRQRIAAKEDIVPAGTIHLFAGETAPTGFLLCQGQTVSRNSFPNLFAAIGTNYGAGNGSTTFGIPDMQSRVAVGRAASGTFAALNNRNSVATETHTLSVAEMATHTHIQNPHNHTQNSHNHALNLWVFNGVASGVTRYGAGSGTNTGAINQQGSGELGGNFNNATTASNIQERATNQNEGGLAGVTQAHNNLQPYIVLNYIIKT